MIRLRTLGGVDLRDPGGREIRPLLAQPKRVALLAYLALAPAPGYRRRDKVVALFWPELDDEHARGSLRQALSFLRRTLGDGVVVTRGDDEIGVDGDAMECDATSFLSACAAGMSEDALALYRGEFLDGFFVSDVDPEFQSWVEEERTDLRRRAATCAWSLAERRRNAGDRTAAATLARQAVRLMPDNEREAARLIAWLDELGDRAGAIAAYEEFAARLEREYDARPAPETQEVIRRIRARTQAADGPAEPARATARPHAPVADLPAAGVSPAMPGQWWTRPRRRLAAGVVLGLAGIALLARQFSTSSDPRVATSGAPLTLAVLPLRDLNSDSSTRYIAEGLTDELITQLAQGSALRVISSRTMLAYRDSALTPAAIAQKLHAGAVVSGTVQYVADTVHENIQLSRAGEDGAALGRTFIGTRGELLRMQHDVARELAREIGGSSVTAKEGDLASARPVNREAVELFIRGRYYWSRRGGANLLKSIDLFTQAQYADPLFAPAWSGMADAYVQLGYASLLAPKDAFPKAEQAAERAVELDSTLAEPHATLGFVNLYYRWDWPAAEREFRKSIALNASYATAYEWYGLHLTAMGRYDEAIRSERRAQELDPLSAAVTGTAAWVLYYSRRVSDARREIAIALRMDSAYALGHLYLGRILQEQGHLDSAVAEYAMAGVLRNWIPTVAGEGYLQAQLGRTREAEVILARMDSASRSSYVTAYGVALVWAAMGNADSTFAWLDRGVQERTHWMVWLNRDPRWAPVRKDPRFAAIVRRVGLPP